MHTNSWAPFPYPGIVIRVSAGWPPPPIYKNERQVQDKKFTPDEKENNLFKLLFNNDIVQEKLYSYCGDMRDLDIEMCRRMLPNISILEVISQSGHASLISNQVRFRDLVVSLAGSSDGSGIGAIASVIPRNDNIRL